MYNQEHLPKPAGEGKSAAVNFSYEEVLVLLNLMHDMHIELDKPESERLRGYPTERVRPAHDVIYKRFLNLKLSLEFSE